VEKVVPAGELRQIHEQAAHAELQSARTVLDAARVPYTCRLIVGHRAQSIADVAQELRCDRILLGPAEARPALGERMFGSLAQQLRHILGSGSCQVIGP
jgi:nucleotide-binding universal stress UspA family protein